MSFKLKEAVYKVRCREPGCPFFSEFIVKENIMGVTEADVDSESIRIARNLAYIKHDAIYGRKHQLANPEVFKISGSYERLGALSADSVFTPPAHGQSPALPPGRSFRKGEVILHRNEDAALVCEVMEGSARNVGPADLRYRQGAVFGTAPLFHQKNRPADVVAAEDGTRVVFHDMKELTRASPAKARELYDHSLDDIFHILMHLEEYSESLEKKLKKLASAPRPGAPRPSRRQVSSKPVAGAARKRLPSRAAVKKRTPAKAHKR